MRKFTRFLMLWFFAGLLSMASFADVQVGNGTTTNQSLPIEPYYGYSYSQVIYLASEIGTSGTITELKWDFAGSSLSNSNDWTIYIGHTTKTAFSSSTDWIDVSTLTQVYSGTFSDPGTSGWITFDITDFAYNGTDNLVIAVDENASSYNSGSDDFHCTSVTGNRGLEYHSDGTNPDPVNPPSGNTKAYIANIVLVGISQACPAPSNQTETNITSSSADLGWTENGSATTWEIEYGPAGFSQGSGTTVTATSNPYTLSGLSGATDYDWYIRADCGGGSYSNWVGPHTFTTPGTCGTWSVELYDTWGDGWNGGQIDLYINGTLYANYTLSSGNGPEYHDFPVNTGDIVSVDYTAGSYSTENEYRVYDAAGGGGNMLAEEGAGGATPGDVGDYTVPTGLTACAACPDPTAQAVANITTTSADLSWTENGSATTWDIELGAAGFVPTGTPTQSGVTNPYTYGGLSASTSYDWYVRSDCGSNWVGPNTFTTACNAITALPYSEDFDGGVEWPACWSEGGDNVFGIGTPLNGAGSSVYCSYSNQGHGYLYTPTFDMTGKSNLHVRFFHYWRADYNSEIQDGYFYGSPDGGTTVYTLGEWHHNNPAFTFGWNEYDISSWADGATDLTFWFDLNMGYDWYWYIDYFGLQEGAFGTHGEWTGATDSDWHTASNWDDGIVPFSFSDVTIPAGLTNYPTASAAGYYAFMDVASDATGDASLLTGGNLSMTGGGSATVHRYVTTDQWHLIGASTSGNESGMFLDDWLESFDEPSNSYNYISVEYKPLDMGTGFALYDKTGEGTDNNFSYTGSLSTGESIALTRSAAGQNNGWNLVANPFPSAIDWNAASGWTKNNVGGSIYLYNSGQWAIWNGTTGTNGATQYIPMGQGFFVTVNDDGSTSGTLGIDYDAQVHNGQGFFKNEVSNMVKVSVNGTTGSDEMVVVFDENATTEFDSQYDAYKLMNLDENVADIYAVTDVQYAINTTPAVKSMPVNVRAKAGTYTIGIVEGDLQVTLEDTYTGEMIDLNATDYTFDYVENQDARFVLYFGALSVEDDLADMINVFDSRGSIVVSVPTSVDAQIVVSNVLGQKVANVKAVDGQTIIDVDNDATYLVRVISNGTIVTEKVFVK